MLTGFIYTNTKLLAALLDEPQERITKILLRYADRCKSYINWEMVDLSDPLYAELDKRNWEVCSSILYDFLYGMGLEDVRGCPLFIIGGDDIVPMPVFENPMSGVGKKFLYADMLYCFPKTDEVCVNSWLSDKPIFAVGRLPLPLRTNKSNINQQDLSSYLDTCVSLVQSRIAISEVGMEVAESFLIPSRQILDDLRLTYDNMLVSPPVQLPDQESSIECSQMLRNSNFFVTCLHGSDRQLLPYYYGESGDHTYHPIALEPQLLLYQSPKIFNTVACFGARYIGYDQEASMLLSALSNGTMLYCGSCDTAITGVNRMAHATAMMSFYNVYLHQGYPAGMALLKAKQDFYRSCHLRDGDSFSLYTILEFNLFGCPILSVSPRLEMEYRPMLMVPAEEKGLVTYHPETAKPLFKAIIKGEDMRSRVKLTFDKQLIDISSAVENALAQEVGAKKGFLEQVLQLSYNHKEAGYRFVYTFNHSNTSEGDETKYILDADMHGNVLSIMRTI